MNVQGSPKVLFIVGAGRSGSTLVDHVVGQAPGFFSMGELNALWVPGLVQGELCGCGVPLPNCSFWNSVLARAFGSEGVNPTEVAAAADQHVRIRPRQLISIQRSSRSSSAASPPLAYARVLERVYRAAADISGAHVLIDSTKAPAHALVVDALSTVDLYVLHLVRDPRAVAYSWLRNADAGSRSVQGEIPFRAMGLLASTAQWVFRAATVEALLRPRLGERYMQLGYEAFSSEPRAATLSIERFLGENSGQPQFVSSHTAHLGENHIVSGNRSKHTRGSVTIRVDDAWRREMRTLYKLECSAVAWPFMLKYGYSPDFSL